MNNVPTHCDLCGSVNISLKRLHPKSPSYASRRSWPFVYRCHGPNCGAECGLRQDSSEPLGVMANSYTRGRRRKAHLALDKLWKASGPLSRKAVYERLAMHLNLSSAECHIGQFNSEQCERTIRFATDFRATLRRKNR